MLRRTKPKKGKNVSSIKKKCWKLFSEYIRRKYSDSNGNARCISCGAIKPWKQMQSGHYIDGRCNAVLFEEDLVHVQCFACNCMLHGKKSEYAAFMYETYGEDRVNELRVLSKTTVKRSYSDYEILEQELKQKLKKLGEDRKWSWE